MILALFGACAAWFGQNLPATLRARVLSVQAAVGVAFYAFILFTSNPFTRLATAPFDGEGLNRFCRISAWRCTRLFSIWGMSAFR